MHFHAHFLPPLVRVERADKEAKENEYSPRREREREREREKPFKEALRKGDWKVSRGLKHAKTCLVSVMSRDGGEEREKRVLSLLHPRVSSDYLNARVSHQRFEYF